MSEQGWNRAVLGDPDSECACGHRRDEHGYTLGVLGKGRCKTDSCHCPCERFIAKGKNHEHKFDED